MLEAVYLDLLATKSVVGIVPKPAFYPLFESLLDESARKVRVYSPNPEPSQEGTGQSPIGAEVGEGQEILSWWRRGRVELGLKHGLSVLVAINWRLSARQVPCAAQG
jgi:hypothetical protein